MMSSEFLGSLLVSHFSYHNTGDIIQIRQDTIEVSNLSNRNFFVVIFTFNCNLLGNTRNLIFPIYIDLMFLPRFACKFNIMLNNGCSDRIRIN